MTNLKTTMLLLLVSTFLYAQSPAITRIDGVGAGNTFLEISEETRFSIFSNTLNGEIPYLPDHGPIKITVTDPDNYTLGDYELTLIDEDMTNSELDTAVFWQLRHIPSGTIVISDAPITSVPSQYVPEFGITVEVLQTEDAGQIQSNNGAIGSSFEYADSQGPQWFSTIPDGNQSNPNHLNYIKTNVNEIDNSLDPGQDFSLLGEGLLLPYTLCDWRANGPPDIFDYFSPSWMHPNSDIVRVGNRLDKLNNIDLVFTSDKNMWSRCVILETANPQYYSSTGLGLATENIAENMGIRNTPSVGVDMDSNGLPIPDGDPRLGMGWFPGYAVDVETGERLNVLFGENSSYSLDQDTALLNEYDITADDFETAPTGRDMLWNPSSEILIDAGVPNGFRYQHYLGGQHFIYVTSEVYDECESLHQRLTGSDIDKIFALRKITWTAMPVLTEGTSLLSLADGLIPNDLIIKLRVDNPYQVKTGTGDFNGYPTYQFELDGMVSANNPQENNWTSSLDLSPNPYSSTDHPSWQLHHLPANCTLTLLDSRGQHLWQKDYQNIPSSSVTAVSSAELPALAKGIYFVRIQEKNGTWTVLKWVVI